MTESEIVYGLKWESFRHDDEAILNIFNRWFWLKSSYVEPVSEDEAFLWFLEQKIKPPDSLNKVIRCFDEGYYVKDGLYVSVNTDDPFTHETLYQTRDGWLLERWTIRETGRALFRDIEPEEAVRWLIKNGYASSLVFELGLLA